MYIIVKQLSKANPTKNLHRANCQKFPVKAVSTPAMKPIILHPAKAGTLPNLSAIQPNNRPPTIAPMKNIDCANVGSVEFSQTQFNLKLFFIKTQNFYLYIFFKLPVWQLFHKEHL